MNGLSGTIQNIQRALRYECEDDKKRMKNENGLFNEFVRHLFPRVVRRSNLKITYTLCLGGLAFTAFMILVASGLLLMVYYQPSTERAFESILFLESNVPGGSYIRNLHRLASHVFLLFIFLHPGSKVLATIPLLNSITPEYGYDSAATTINLSGYNFDTSCAVYLDKGGPSLNSRVELSGYANDVYVAGSYAYVVSGIELKIINISNVVKPVITSRIALADI
ncbi:MAG: DUF4405 domain-containing protein, partial [Proteobacteria bacterium]|nr:DUF4405 domain-containing protein [Pseudomonadota bacterium]